VPLPGPDVPLTVKELDRAWKDASLRSWSAQRLTLAVLEKIVNANGYTIMRSYEPSRLLELAATMMVFVIALVLRQIREAVLGRGGS